MIPVFTATQTCALFGKARAQRPKEKNALFAPFTDCLICVPTTTAALVRSGLRPRGDESDQSDQSTEITVIPEVRGRAPGHAEFTHLTQALRKSVHV